MNTTSMGVNLCAIDTRGDGLPTVAAIRSAIDKLGVSQGTIGTLENRLQFAINLAQSQLVNTKGAESHIRNANVGEESASSAVLALLR